MADKEKAIIPLKYQGKEIFSFSKLSTFHNCEYEYYLTYIQSKSRIDNIYTILGSTIHSLMEELQQCLITNEKAVELFEQKVLECNILDIKFPSEKIEKNFVECIKHYFMHYIPIQCESFEIEKQFTTLVSDTLILGYIDLIVYRGNGVVEVFDYKSSTMYDKKEFIKHARQLLIYGYALAKEHNLTINKLAFNMLKYVKVNYMGKTKMLSKVCLRNAIVPSLRKEITQSLKSIGKTDIEIELLINESTEKNTLINLPMNIQDKFEFEDCYIEYEYNDDTLKDLFNHVDSTTQAIKNKDKNNELDWKPKDIEENSFYCATLCSHRRNCRYFREFVENNSDDFKPKLDENLLDLFK